MTSKSKARGGNVTQATFLFDREPNEKAAVVMLPAAKTRTARAPRTVSVEAVPQVVAAPEPVQARARRTTGKARCPARANCASYTCTRSRATPRAPDVPSQKPCRPLNLRHRMKQAKSWCSRLRRSSHANDVRPSSLWWMLPHRLRPLRTS